MISVLRSWKGHDYFIEAAQHVLDYFPDVHFIIAGDGPRREAIESKIRRMNLTKSVHLIGHRHDVANVIAGLKALVLPSYAHEGIPQIVLQAQAMAKPVIGTNIGGIPEVIENDQTGLLVPPKDIHLLADSIERILSDEMLCRFLGEQSLNQILNNYTFEHMCERTERLYHQYLSKK
jgi:glycosyltransferase involved in cell wall biosynthesis